MIAKSSNIGTVLAAAGSSSGQLRDYLTSSASAQRTDVGVAGETPGLLPDPQHLDRR